ncbi:50S ribosomal protein [Dirofilaria immitis]
MSDDTKDACRETGKMVFVVNIENLMVKWVKWWILFIVKLRIFEICFQNAVQVKESNSTFKIKVIRRG